MKRLLVPVLLFALLVINTGCSSIGRVHVLIGATVEKDAANALAIAEQSGDVAMERCAATTLAAAEKAPRPEQVTGILSGLAAKRAREALLDKIRRDCGEVYLATRAALVRMGLFGLF